MERKEKEMIMKRMKVKERKGMELKGKENKNKQDRRERGNVLEVKKRERKEGKQSEWR